jgi:hypothetical protein
VPTRGPVVRALIGLGLVCGAILALASSIVLHGLILVLVLVTAGLAGGVAYHARDGDRAASVEAAWKAAAWTVSIILLVVGLTVLAGGAGAAVISGLAVVTAAAVWQLKARRARHAGRGAPGPARLMGDGDRTPMPPAVLLSRSQPPVSLLSTSVLGTEWLRTTAALASPLEPAARQAVIRHRQETLDELERRDPAGFARWLGAGAATESDPSIFVRGDGATGSDAA